MTEPEESKPYDRGCIYKPSVSESFARLLGLKPSVSFDTSRRGGGDRG